MAVHLLDRNKVRARREERGPLSLLRHVDLVLVASTVAIALFGLVMVYSATRTMVPFEPTYYLKRQIVYFILGSALMVGCALFDYRRLEQWGYLLYGLVVLALAAVFVVGRQASVTAGSGSNSLANTQRWIPLGPVELQPSEFGVLALIIAVGLYVHHHEKDIGVKRLAVLVGLAVVPMLLVFKQPDLGTTVILVVVFAALLVFGGVRARYLVAFTVLAGLAIAGVFELHLLQSYELSRITCLFHPNVNTSSTCYELQLSKEAIGNGGFHGTGLFQGVVTNLQYVPVQYADFIFSAVGEQTGFLGAIVLLGLYGLVSLRIFRAMQTARDTFGRMICGGALIFLVFSVFQNVGMNLGIMPITGIPLPFVSYGGSALLAFFAMIGLVVNVEMHRYRAR